MSAWNEPIYPWNVQFDLHSYLLTEMPVMMTIMMTMLFSSAPSFFLSTFCALLLFTWQAFCWSNLDWFGKLIRYTPPHLSNQAPSSPCHCLSAHERWESARDVESCWYLHCTPRLPHTSTCELKSSNLPPHHCMLKEKLIKLVSTHCVLHSPQSLGCHVQVKLPNALNRNLNTLLKLPG